MKLDQNYRVSGTHWQKRNFNPAKKADLEEFRYFVDHSHWKEGCPFVVEWPHTNVIAMVQDKIAKHHLGALIKAAKA